MIDKITSPVFNRVTKNLNTPSQPQTPIENNQQSNKDPFKCVAFYGKDLVQTQQKSNADLSVVFKKLEANREDWAINDRYLFPGSIQYWGPSEVCDITTQTLKLESEAKLARV